MSSYSIKDLERISGIKAHTIRIWEKRYGLIAPCRSCSNIRLYTDEELRFLLSVSFLNKNGLKISKIAELGQEEVREEIISIIGREAKADPAIDGLTVAMVEMDEKRFEKIISCSILKQGLEYSMVHLIFPFLQKAGFMWQIGAINPAQEHFMSNLIRQKLISAIDGQVMPETMPKGVNKIVCFLPDGEYHEIGLLFFTYFVRTQGYSTVYLGQSVPAGDLEKVCSIHAARYLLSVITIPPPGASLQEYVDSLSKDFPNSTLLLSGAQFGVEGIETLPANVKLFKDLDALRTLIVGVGS